MQSLLWDFRGLGDLLVPTIAMKIFDHMKSNNTASSLRMKGLGLLSQTASGLAMPYVDIQSLSFPHLQNKENVYP